MEKCTLHESSNEAEQTCFIGQLGNQRMVQNVAKAYDKTGGFSQVKNGNKFYKPAQQGGRSVVRVSMICITLLL